MRTRIASTEDADEMGRVLREIIAQTGRERQTDTASIISNYIANPDGIRCTIAVDDAGNILGFQSIKRASAGNHYNVPEGWGIIGTHITPRVHRQGVGRALFSSSKEAAQQAGLQKIDAYIGADNASGLHYYEAMGFRTYREPDGVVQKVFTVRKA